MTNLPIYAKMFNKYLSNKEELYSIIDRGNGEIMFDFFLKDKRIVFVKETDRVIWYATKSNNNRLSRFRLFLPDSLDTIWSMYLESEPKGDLF